MGECEKLLVTVTRQTQTKPHLYYWSKPLLANQSPNLLLVKMKEKKLLKMQSLPKVLRSQAMRQISGDN
jgi:hypothetical protein